MSASSKSRRAKRKASSARKKSVRPTPRAARKKSADASWPKRVTGRITVLSAPTLAKLSWAVHGFSTRKGGASKLTGTHSTTSAPVLNLGFTEWDKRETPTAAHGAAEREAGRLHAGQAFDTLFEFLEESQPPRAIRIAQIGQIDGNDHD